jgi:hypothetical protein
MAQYLRIVYEIKFFSTILNMTTARDSEVMNDKFNVVQNLKMLFKLNTVRGP